MSSDTDGSLTHFGTKDHGEMPPLRDTLVLGIETTCDETAAAVLRRHADGSSAILSNIVHSQLADHAPFGGVVPEIAARAHLGKIRSVTAQAVAEAGIAMDDLDAIAAAAGPGLIGGVIVGLTTAKALALALDKPFIAINHLEAHALTARLTDGIAFPYLMLLASGGHTQLLAVRGVGQFTKLGTTMDDAIGEAFDKVAKMLGLPYPGGPHVEKMAQGGDPFRFRLPRPLLGRAEPDFSLSGLKTAVRLEIARLTGMTAADRADLCASFQQAVADMVADRCKAAIAVFRATIGEPRALVIAGGVAANQTLRAALAGIARRHELPLCLPPLGLCTDNGAMIAWAGLERLALGLNDPLDFAPRARWPLDEAHATIGFGRLGAKA